MLNTVKDITVAVNTNTFRSLQWCLASWRGFQFTFFLLYIVPLVCPSWGTGFQYKYPSTLQTSKDQLAAGFLNRRNWCPYTVTKTISCQVQNGTYVQRVYQSCRWPLGCPSGISYRAVLRPTYRLTYKTVTAMEWRCCAGFRGTSCEEENGNFLEALEGGRHVSHNRRLFPKSGDFPGCLNCTKISQITSRLSTLEAKVCGNALINKPCACLCARARVCVCVCCEWGALLTLSHTHTLFVCLSLSLSLTLSRSHSHTPTHSCLPLSVTFLL
uniref:EMI domain-containing protein n=1 Tax=Callorhinchus milii TaxID=7868 RepID=A0A4W3HEJ7_CALMI